MRVWKWAAGMAAVVVVSAGAAWLAVPAVVQSQLQSRGSELLGRELRVQRVEFVPWALQLTLHGLRLAGPGGSTESQLEIERLHIDADLRSLIKLAPVIEAIEVDAPRLRLQRAADGRWNVDDIVQRLARNATPATPPSEPARFALFNLQLRGGQIRVDDRAADRVHTLADIKLALPFLSTLPADVRVTVEPLVSMRIDGDPVELRGRTLPYAEDRATELDLRLVELDLARWWAYLPPGGPLQPVGGRLDADLALKFTQPPGQTARAALSGKLALRGLAANNAAGAPMLALKALSVELADVRPLERVLTLGAVTLDGAELQVRRDAAGVIEWARLSAGNGAKVPARTAVEPAAAPASSPWAVAAGKLQIRASRVVWQDGAVRPAAALAVEDLALSTEGLRWPALQRMPVQGSARLAREGQAPGTTVGTLQFAGEASDRDATIKLTLADLQLGAAAPYLRTRLSPTLEGQAHAVATLDWARGDPARTQVQIDEAGIDGLRITEAGSKLPALSITSIGVAAVQLDLLAQRLVVGEVNVKAPALRLSRAADGLLNVQRWAAPPVSGRASAAPVVQVAPGATATSKAKPWLIELKSFGLDGGKLSFSDAAARAGAPLVLEASALQVGVSGFEWPASARGARMDVSAQLRVPPQPGEPPEPPGRLKASGVLALATPSWRGQVDLQRWPVAAFEPYFGAHLPVHLQRAELGLRGDLDVRWPPAGLQVLAKADVQVADVLVRARAAAGAGASASASASASAGAVGPGAAGGGDELMSWQSLTLRPLELVIGPAVPPRITIGELRWSDFYSRLVITEDGRFNLRDVAAEAPAAAPAASAPVVPVPPVAALTPASAASAPAAGSTLPFELVIDRTALVNGKVDFTDRFIRPNYSAALSELNGSLGRLDSRTRDMATLDLRGRAAGTALLEIRGAVNPTAEPLALDITARASDLELAPLSPYAGKYAGYAIERGKLSMDVAYRIDPDGKLAAKNQVILNQLTFGEKIDSPDATKLPVRLAVALLTDRNGVIDINLPVSGSINDPQFSVWGIVWKLIGNLLVKAFTAPFALLAGGDGPDLSLVPFVPGTATPAAAGTANLERVAKALGDRPALRMTVIGAADPVSEREAMRTAALDARIAAEQRRELARAGVPAAPVVPVAPGPGAASAPAPAAAPTPAQRALIVKRLYADTRLPDKPRNLLGMAKDIPVEQMETMLKAATVVSTDSARELAIQRGLAVLDALIAKGLPSERLFLGAPKVIVPGEGDAAWSPRVQLSLTGP